MTGSAQKTLPETVAAQPPDHALRLVIFDRHQLFRECLAAALRQDTRVEAVDVVESEAAAKEVLMNGHPDVLLIGLEPGDRCALGLTSEVVELDAAVKVLIFGVDEEDDGALDFLEAGAAGYLFRDQSLGELLSAIERIAQGDMVCAPRIGQKLFSRLAELGQQRRRSEQLEFLTLTARELEILSLIAQDLSNYEISRRLYLSVHTVKNHVHSILERLGVRSRLGAVHHALGKGWLPRGSSR